MQTNYPSPILTSLFEFVAADDPSHDDEWQLRADRAWHIQILLSDIPGPDEYQVVHFCHNSLLGVPALKHHGCAFQDLRAAMHYCTAMFARLTK